MQKVITGNVMRALQRLKDKPADASFFVEEEFIPQVLKLINTTAEPETRVFSLKKEFDSQYSKIKTAMDSMGAIETKEDLDILKEAQKFLTFILRHEEKLASIEAVKDFKEAVLNVLDEESHELRDRVIRRLGEPTYSV